MISDSRVIAVIPARGGSKSVPGKNIRPLGGKPLIVWAIEAAFAVRAIDRVIVSTDDRRIGEVAQAAGAELYLRPEALAQDHSLVIDAIKDLIGRLRDEGERADVMVLLEPTCPFRAPQDIADCLRLMDDRGADSVATFRQACINPHRTWAIEDNAPRTFITGVDPWQPRQALPEAYQLNGAVYAFRMSGVLEQQRSLLFGRMRAVVMPDERSMDIDTEQDFARAEAVLRTQA